MAVPQAAGTMTSSGTAAFVDETASLSLPVEREALPTGVARPTATAMGEMRLLERPFARIAAKLEDRPV
ncbi:MAG: hypothetical protein WD049_03070 [Candidatus Paceibacterota bacterium]